ncbi:cell surface glycoprotein 1-like [Drosophila sulfurigaster albostrigata]|uniref:cell surface glycoprotein 1-like n=1 Tax=Drosophila sulfurigaster albostrigata TaxID=89887 RepID=UPI002D21CEC4|nr:cell surface glycoprotein 1-like [Drosophila sulfurigaster albostrigata]
MEPIDLTLPSPPRDYAGEDEPRMTPDPLKPHYSQWPEDEPRMTPDPMKPHYSPWPEDEPRMTPDPTKPYYSPWPEDEPLMTPHPAEPHYSPWPEDDLGYRAGIQVVYNPASEGESEEERPYEEDDESKQEESSEAEEPFFRLPPGAWSPRPGQRRDPRLGRGVYGRPPSPTETEAQQYQLPPTEDSDADEPFIVEEVDRTETPTSYFELPERWNYRGPAIADRPVPPPYFPPAFRRPMTPILRRLEEMDVSDPDGFPLPMSSYDPPQEGPRWESASSDDEPDGPRFRRQYARTSPANEESDPLADLLEVLGQDLVPLE